MKEIRNHLAVAISAALLLTGCLSVDYYAKKSPEVIAHQVTMNDDSYKAEILYSAPTVIMSGFFEQPSYFLRGWKDRNTGAMRHQLYVSVWEEFGWVFYQSATFKGGHQPKSFLLTKRSAIAAEVRAP